MAVTVAAIVGVVVVPIIYLTLEGIRGGGGQIDPLSIFLALNILFLNRLPKALVQLFFVC